MMTAFRLLLIDDDATFASTMARALQRQHWQVQTAADADSALQWAASAAWDAVLLDLRLGSDNGLLLLHDLRQHLPQARIVMLTGFGSIATAVEAIKRGADDYLVKPAPLADVMLALQGQSKTVADTETERLAEQPLNLRQLSWEHIQRVLTEHDGNISAAARALGMHRRTLQRKLSKAPRPR